MTYPPQTWYTHPVWIAEDSVEFGVTGGQRSSSHSNTCT